MPSQSPVSRERAAATGGKSIRKGVDDKETSDCLKGFKGAAILIKPGYRNRAEKPEGGRVTRGVDMLPPKSRLKQG